MVSLNWALAQSIRTCRVRGHSCFSLEAVRESLLEKEAPEVLVLVGEKRDLQFFRQTRWIDTSLEEDSQTQVARNEKSDCTSFTNIP
jgi:hypothetical protein